MFERDAVQGAGAAGYHTDRDGCVVRRELTLFVWHDVRKADGAGENGPQYVVCGDEPGPDAFVRNRGPTRAATVAAETVRKKF